MIYLAIGIPLFFLTLILGILLMTETCDFCDNQTIGYLNYTRLGNGIVWIASIVMIIVGLRKRSKNKHQKIMQDEKDQLEKEKLQWNAKQQQDKEIQELKDKVKKLEDEKKDD